MVKWKSWGCWEMEHDHEEQKYVQNAGWKDVQKETIR